MVLRSIGLGLALIAFPAADKPLSPQSASRWALERAKWPLLAAVVAIAYLPYFYADVMLQIASLPAMIFFMVRTPQKRGSSIKR